MLRLQVKHLVKTNSGVLLRSTELEGKFPKSIEAQVMSGKMGDIYNFHKFSLKTDPKRTRGAGTKKIHESNVLGLIKLSLDLPCTIGYTPSIKQSKSRELRTR